MNPAWTRNIALVLIAGLLWHVGEGIYWHEFRRISTPPLLKPPIHYTVSPPVEKEREKKIERDEGIPVTEHQMTYEQLEQTLRTGRLPSPAPGVMGRKLSTEELDEIQATGKLPDQ